jgi:transmembrane sensor
MKRDESDPMTVLAMTADDEVSGLTAVQREAYDWISRFMRGDMSAGDIAAMKAWYGQSPGHAAAYAEARRVWKALGPIASARMQPGAEASPVVTAIPARRGLSGPLGRRAFIGGALAASAAYMLAKPPLDLWPSYSELIADYRTAAGEHKQLTLADAVSLDLNTKTSISVRSQTGDQTQIDFVTGEAAFSTGGVASELTVFAGAGRVVTTRSDFNLRSDGAQVSITCLAGSLNVIWNDKVTRIDARQQLAYTDRDVGQVATVEPDDVTAWRRGQLVFERTPVAEVVAEINRYRSGRIVLMNDEIGKRHLTARLSTSQTDRIVTQIVHIFGAKARHLPGGVVVLT